MTHSTFSQVPQPDSIPLPQGLETVKNISCTVDKHVTPIADGHLFILCKNISEKKDAEPPVLENTIKESDRLTAYAKHQKFTGAKGSSLSLFLTPSHIVTLIGLGKDADSESDVQAGATTGSKIYQDDPEQAEVVITQELVGDRFNQHSLMTYLVRLLFTLVKNQEYKGAENRDPMRKIKSLKITTDMFTSDEVAHTYQIAKKLAINMLITAALVDAPPNYAHCVNIAKLIEKEAKARNLTVEILDTAKCAELNMGAFLAVAQGSVHGARLVHITYKEGAGSRRIALVGKGITMDTGGYCVKPASSMEWMKTDMAGAAAVLGTALSVADLKIKDCEYHFIAMLAENAIDKHAYRAGDIITASNGKTIEVHNTDAEGRLALCDGLVFAQKILKDGGIVIDVATLTGACMVALGMEIAAVYSNTEKLRSRIVEAATVVGEPAWPMPLREKYTKKSLKSHSHVDICNASNGARYGGSMTAAGFLQEFIENGVEWAHMDVAGPVWDWNECRATAYGVCTLTKLLE